MRHASGQWIAPVFLALGIFIFLSPADATSRPLVVGEAEAALRQSAEFLRRGDFEQAASLAAAAAGFYAQAGKADSQQAALLQLAEAQQALGEYQEAAQSLHQGLGLAKARGDTRAMASFLGMLGNLFIALGPPEKAEQYLLQAKALAGEASASALRALILNNLGNYYAFQEKPTQALTAFAQSAALAGQSENSLLAARALANAARVALQADQARQAQALAAQAQAKATRLADSHDKVYLLVNLARTFTRLEAQRPETAPPLHLQAYQLLREAHDIARSLADPRAASYALGYLGALYEREARYEEALTLTRQAIFQAQQVGADQPLYRWHWQTGRLLTALGWRAAAMEAYQKAVHLLQDLRFQMTLAYGPPGLSFQEAVGPVYLELVDLLLKQASEDPAREEALLRQARETMEQLKAAELRDYFRDPCVDALQAKIRGVEELSPSAVVVYPILLEDRAELLLTLPGGTIKRYSTPIGSKVFSEEIHRFRRLLEKQTTHEYLHPGQILYRWLIAPFEGGLPPAVKTLVFVPGGPLRTIPLAALFDGQQFLIEKYAVATIPSMRLTDPQPLNPDKINLVLGGLSIGTEGFPPLGYVSQELKTIRQLYGGRLLLNETFQHHRLKETLQNEAVNVLHLATHSQFLEKAHNSFLLTYDGRISLNELSEFVGLFKYRDTPLELLVLSACETARGDDRAALGLSGIAVRAGARSALGTLWKVQDMAAATLMESFYRQLKENPQLSRAVALQRAQEKLLNDLRYRHPNYWSAFVLINSWL